MPAGEPIFLDTNILLAATDRSRAAHRTARTLVDDARQLGLSLAWSGQVVREYLVVATRPMTANGLGLAPHDALRNIGLFGTRLAFCEENEGTSERLRELVRIYSLIGTAIHDANIVATMGSHRIDRIVTLNPDDFARYSEVTVLDIASIISDPGGSPQQG